MSRVSKSAGTCRVPSEKACLKCYGNLFSVWSLMLLEFPLMSNEDMIAYLVNAKHEMDKVRALNNMDFISLIDTKLTHAIKSLDQKNVGEISILSDDAKISVSGNKGDFCVNAGWYFFNLDNPHGLHLSKNHTESIICMLRDKFRAFDGSPFSHRYMVDKIAFGRNNEPEETD